MLEALAFGHEQCKQLARIQKELMAQAAKPRWAFDAQAGADPALRAQVQEVATARWCEALAIHEKQARAEALTAAFEATWTRLVTVDHVPDEPAMKAKAREYFDKVEKTEVRRLIVDKGIRVDGRSVTEVRPIWSEVGYLPSAHGSALFTRGETQALVAATLGTKNDEQKLESFEGDATATSCSTTTSRPSPPARSSASARPGRREIGHGALAQRAISAVLPRARTSSRTPSASCPRSSSPTARRRWPRCAEPPWRSWTRACRSRRRWRASPWGSSRKARRSASSPTSWAARTTTATWTSRSPAPTRASPRSRWTSRSPGVSVDIMRQALAQAREARLHVLGKMARDHQEPRARDCRAYAPRFVTIKIRPEKIREIIGPGRQGHPRHPGEDGAKIDVEDDGKVTVFSAARGAGADGRRHHPGHLPRSGARSHLPRQGQEHQGVRRLRGDHAGHRGAPAHLPDRRGAYPRRWGTC